MVKLTFSLAGKYRLQHVPLSQISTILSIYEILAWPWCEKTAIALLGNEELVGAYQQG